jgi:nicotinamide-nucleotide amidase
MEAEIITIGTELLLGEIIDTNTHTIARALREIGLDLHRTTSVGDNPERIAQVVRESMTRAQVLITTGGLGPTVDDPTREAIAKAMNLALEFKPELWQEIQDRFRRYGRTPGERNRLQAFIPQGAIPISNPVGTAPAFIVESEANSVIALPGVPAELEVLLESAILPYLRDKFQLRETIYTRVLRIAGAGESWLDERMTDLEQWTNPTLGLAAHPGRVDLRITAKAVSESEARSEISRMETILRERLGALIYGVDQDTLEEVILKMLREKGWKLATVESGTGGALCASLEGKGKAFVGGLTLPGIQDLEKMAQTLDRFMEDRSAQTGIGLGLYTEPERRRVEWIIRISDQSETRKRGYGGPPHTAPAWAVSQVLEALRQRLA